MPDPFPFNPDESRFWAAWLRDLVADGSLDRLRPDLTPRARRLLAVPEPDAEKCRAVVLDVRAVHWAEHPKVGDELPWPEGSWDGKIIA